MNSEELKLKIKLAAINAVAYAITFVGILLFLIPCILVFFAGIVGQGIE